MRTFGNQVVQGAFVICIDVRPDDMRAAGKQADGRYVVGFDQKVRHFGNFTKLGDLAFIHHEGQCREDDFLSGILKPLDDVRQMLVEKRHAFGANDFANMYRINVGFIRDPGIEILFTVFVPVKQNRPHDQS